MNFNILINLLIQKFEKLKQYKKINFHKILVYNNKLI